MADFIDEIKALGKTVAELKDSLQTEAATKQALILPFFSKLGYNVFDPRQFLPEPAADVGIKQGEKVDYAIMFEKDGQRDPMILIECKWCGSPLVKKDSEVFRHFGLSQLFRYFGTTTAKYAILTNGITYQFFTDLDEPNKMDLAPFLEIDMLNLQESAVAELKRFHKESFDPVEYGDTASNLRYMRAVKNFFGIQLENPDEEFVKWFTAHVYDGVKTSSVVDRFTGIVKTALNDFIAERLNDKIRIAFGPGAVRVDTGIKVTQAQDTQQTEPSLPVIETQPTGIITTEEELQCFYAVKSMLNGVLPLERVTYKDTETYFGVLVDGMVTKWICRSKSNKSGMTVVFPKMVEEPYDKETKHDFASVDELYNFAEPIIMSAKRFAE